MAITLDTSAFLDLVVNTETVSYAQKTGEGTFAAGVNVENAKWRAITKEDQMIDSSLLHTQNRICHLGRDYLGVIVPKRGDQITAADLTVWVVQRVEVQSFLNRFRCTCLKKVA